MVDLTTYMRSRYAGKRSYRRPLKGVRFIAVHRNSCATSAEGLIDWFSETYPTWGRPGYHVVIDRQGNISRLVPFTWSAPGAYGFNNTAIHVCLLGDFRTERATFSQVLALQAVLFDLCRTLELPPSAIKGHSELDRRHWKKRCPGDNIDMAALRRVVEMMNG